MNYRPIINKRGFTLVELIIAVSLFAIISFFSLGALLSIYDAHRKSQTSKTVTDNLNLAIENMARTIRFGSSYYCGESSDTSATNDCSGGGEVISVTFNNKRIVYRLDGTAIQRKEGTGAFENITSPDTVIDYVKFYVFGAGTSNTQPYAVAVVKGYVGSKSNTRTTFSIETLMSQRTLEI